MINKNVDSSDPCLDSDSVGPGWDPGICIFTDVIDDSDAGILRTTLREIPT